MNQKEHTIKGVLTELSYLPLDIQLAVFKELFVKFENRIQVQINVNDTVDTPSESEQYIEVEELDSMLTNRDEQDRKNYYNHNQQEFVDEQPLSDYIEPLS